MSTLLINFGLSRRVDRKCECRNGKLTWEGSVITFPNGTSMVTGFAATVTTNQAELFQ